MIVSVIVVKVKYRDKIQRIIMHSGLNLDERIPSSAYQAQAASDSELWDEAMIQNHRSSISNYNRTSWPPEPRLQLMADSELTYDRGSSARFNEFLCKETNLQNITVLGEEVV